ncbi:hypothetical protein [Streptomyces cupreus]|uniref:TPM domain-containing protein n=1 Tax=Streptomyces cupreus TaxID=2759956 RepID=A0A7X1JAK3_9ACTN|nr:hypothetical protein [Streptomyces cupreus]MBC2907188.1 hypothetical protein [Streptomyces cupreus]
MSHSRAAITAVVAALLLTPTAVAADSPSTGERIANALRSSPVYVDEAYASAVPPPRQRQLAREIDRTGLPIKVVLTPLTKGDDFDGEADVLASVVRDRLPQRDLILITTDGTFTDSLNGYEWPTDTHQTADAAAAAGFLDETRDAGLADLTSKAVELVARGDGTEVYEEAMGDLETSPEPSPDPTRTEAGSSWPTWPVVAAVAGLALSALLLVRHRRRTPASARPRTVFATARAADEAALRRRAEAEVVALGESARTTDSAAPGLQCALDAYAAAGTVLDAARGLPDLAGVLALVTEGRDALADSPAPLPLCFFNPLHGRGKRLMTWRPLGRRDRVRVAACSACATALRIHRSPDVLTDVTEDGETVAYFEVPAERSVWAATGYGSLLRGGDSLAGRVARGDFTRSALSD